MKKVRLWVHLWVCFVPLLGCITYGFGAEELAPVKPSRYEYAFSISDQLASHILAKSNLFELGELESMQYQVIIENDNLLLGGGRLLGLESSDRIEGDDFGYTFGLDLNVVRIYEEGEVSFQYLSQLYSRHTHVLNEHGEWMARDPEQGLPYTQNLARDVLTLEVKRDIGGSYQMIIGVGVEQVDDRGLALSLQEGFHELTESLGNKPYFDLDAGKEEFYINGEFGLIKRVTLYESEKLNIIGSTGTKLVVSKNDDYVDAVILSELEILMESSRFQLYTEWGVRNERRVGINWRKTLYESGEYTLEGYVGISYINNVYTRQFQNLGNTTDINYEFGFTLRH